MPKILCGITNCHTAVYPDVLSRKEPPNNTLCIRAARETWIKDATRAGIDVKFFLGRGGTRAPEPDEVFLDCDDSYDGLVDKVTAMCAWALEHDYEYLMKVDVDSYVHVQNLLRESEFFKWDYVGRGWGLGYLLSRKGMEVIAEAKQRRSWAEDSHVLRTIFAYGQKPGNKISMYGDGRFVFLPNLRDEDLPLYDTAFIAVNPLTPEGMAVLNEYQSLEALMPFSFEKDDLWTIGDDRIQHCSVHNAFNIRGEKIPLTYNEWVKLTPYERQPFLDWMQIVFACLETDSMSDCLSFTQWMGPVDHRRELLDACIKINVEAANKIRHASKNFKLDQLRGSNEPSS